MIRVLCVDDNPDLADLLQVIIAAETDMECSGVLTTADHLCDEAERRRPDVVLVDLGMPGRDPLDAVGELAARFPQCRVVILTGRDDRDTIDTAMQRGAWGYVVKNGNIDRILLAVRTVAAGNPFVDRS